VGRNRSRVDPTAGRFTHCDVVRFLDDAFERFEREVPGLPGEPTVGSRQNVMLAALTLSLLEVLEESGVERDVSSFVNEQLGTGQRHTTCRTCDHRDLAIELSHNCSIRLVSDAMYTDLSA
jgi:hypothetical protein